MTEPSHIRAVLLAGPTASGKSALAMPLAENLGGVVVNADSMQVYDGLRIVTARPTPADGLSVPHRLYGFRDPTTPYSVAQWIADIAATLSDGRRPLILTGGTGLYFSSLERGLDEIPEIPSSIRVSIRESAQSKTAEELWALLAARDPRTASMLAPKDGQRIVRALEVLEATGRGMAAWRGGRKSAIESVPTIKLVLEPERSVLHQRIARRCEAMVGEGAIDEVEALVARKLPSEVPLMKAIGVREITEFLHGERTLDEATERMIAATRQYAKRQSTWFRNQFGADWVRVGSAGEALDTLRDLTSATVSS